MRRKDLVFWYPGINPYLSDRFTALAKAGNVDFECWFTRELDPMRSWKVDVEHLDFPHKFVTKVKVGSTPIGIPVTDWAKARPRVLVTFHSDLTVSGSLFQHLIPQSKLVYYLLKTFETWTERSPKKEFIKRRLFQMADGFMTPGTDADSYVRQYSKPSTPILRLDQVIDVEHFAQAQSMRSSQELLNLRAKLDLTGFVFLYVGRLWSGKGVGTLIDAFATLQKEGRDASLLLVGDGPDVDTFKRRALDEGISNVVFKDFVQQEELPGIYALADAFVFPTRGDPYGLVVDEAMASGLPVISTTSAGEIDERLDDGTNGFLIPRDDPASMTSAMERLLTDPRKAQQMGERGFALIRHRTHDHWARQIESNLEMFLRKP